MSIINMPYLILYHPRSIEGSATSVQWSVVNTEKAALVGATSAAVPEEIMLLQL
jgi:hypothetical protein